jgi:hypothetical protein
MPQADMLRGSSDRYVIMAKIAVIAKLYENYHSDPSL